ncbi:MAG: hypothetical protein PHD30_00140 [Paludibacter sp.]|nr:hypothetical protein [Paludibacter sp.]
MKKITFIVLLLISALSIFAVDLTVTGSFPDNSWVNNNTDFLMTEIGTTGIYKLEKTLPAGTYEFKVFYTGTWNGPSDGDNRVIVLTEEKTVSFYAKIDGAIRFFSDVQELYVLGSTVGGWDAANMKLMTNSTADATYTADVVAGTYKIVVKDKNGGIVWNDITPADQTVGGTGNYTIKLDFATFAASATANAPVIPSITGLSDSYIFVGENPDNATWYNANATYQAENFHEKNLGTVSSVLFLGGEIKTTPVLDGVTVKLFYEIEDQGVKLGVNEVGIPWLANDGDKSQWKSATGTNVLTGTTLVNGNTYSLHVWFNATEGTTTLWDSNNMANYVATFIYDASTNTQVNRNIGVRIYTEYGLVRADFEGMAVVELFSITGQQLKSVQVNNEFSETVRPGVYVLRINDKSHKVIVK